MIIKKKTNLIYPLVALIISAKTPAASKLTERITTLTKTR